MKKTMSLYDFRNDMMEIRPDNFSYLGLEALFNYLEDWEQSGEEETEFDPIAICCDFTEDSIVNILDNYNLASTEELEYNTIVIPVDEDTIIIQDY